MQFNSFLFFVFFIATYSIYLSCAHRWQNRILLASSYFFYAAWDYRFLLLILSSTVINFFVGKEIHKFESEIKRKRWLAIGVVINLAFLLFFKYYNFFADNLANLFAWFGTGNYTFSLNILLPVGISFYTFRTMSYTIDIYRKQLTPSQSFLDFALYVSFFPQLIAGPIERAADFLPQVYGKRRISASLFKASAFLFLYGLFEKVVVADNLALLVDKVYDSRQTDGLSVIIATYGFAVQIFADFDGYSNMAKGLAGLMGFRLVDNFNAPYFSTTPSEFWTRWHISLSSWLRDYLYIPLGGNRSGTWKTCRNLFVTMLLGGLWHGASWMFVFWGVFHGVLLLVYFKFEDVITKFPFKTVVFFHLVCFGWMLFRAQDLEHFWFLMSQVVFNFQFSLHTDQLLLIERLLFYSFIPITYQYLQYKRESFYPVFAWPVLPRGIYYLILFYGIVIFGSNNAQSFIYSQF